MPHRGREDPGDGCQVDGQLPDAQLEGAGHEMLAPPHADHDGDAVCAQSMPQLLRSGCGLACMCKDNSSSSACMALQRITLLHVAAVCL